MIKIGRIVWIVIILFVVANSSIVFAESNNPNVGYVDIIGVPSDQVAGEYDLKTEIFAADVSEFEGAYVQITYDDLVITGKMVTWYRGNDYLVVIGDARVVQDDLVLTSDKIEYYGDREELVATNNVEAITEDAVVTSQLLEYNRGADRAEFKQNVIVEVTDGRLYGEHFVMLIEAEEMQFIGSFTGEFQRSTNESQ